MLRVPCFGAFGIRGRDQEGTYNGAELHGNVIAGTVACGGGGGGQMITPGCGGALSIRNGFLRSDYGPMIRC